jgi:hypothetical protein
MFLATLIVDLIGTGLMYSLEHDKPGSEIHSMSRASFGLRRSS